MDELKEEPAFSDLYDGVSAVLAQGYKRTDQLVYFAMDYGIPPEDALATDHARGV